MAILRAPNGKTIVGTKELIPGIALINGASGRNKDGTLNIEWGNGTQVDWNGQETVLKDGQRVFYDTDSNEWTEDQLTLHREG